MNSERGEVCGRRFREGEEYGRGGVRGVRAELDYGPRPNGERIFSDRRDIKSGLYEAWTPEHKAAFRECIVPPKMEGAQAGVDAEKIANLPENHPARRGYVALDVLCAWIDIEMAAGARS